jgi:hypothetical protein
VPCSSISLRRSATLLRWPIPLIMRQLCRAFKTGWSDAYVQSDREAGQLPPKGRWVATLRIYRTISPANAGLVLKRVGGSRRKKENSGQSRCSFYSSLPY